MKSEDNIRNSYRARFNKVARSVEALRSFTLTNPDNLDTNNIADMRAIVEDITQAFHEFNAYRNCFGWDIK